MKSTLMMALGIALFIAVIFGLTLISSFTPSQPPQTDKDPTVAAVTQPLEFGLLSLGFNPLDTSESGTAVRFFDAFHEISANDVPSTFWFRNQTRDPVRVSLAGVSCSACTSARVTTIPPAAMRDFISESAIRQFASSGPLPGLDLHTAVSAAVLLQPLQWHNFNFRDRNDHAEIPPGDLSGLPTWGVLQMGVRVSGLGPKEVNATLSAKTAAMSAPAQPVFSVTLIGAPAFDVSPSEINLSVVPEEAAPRTVEIVYWSVTRPDLPQPNIILPEGDLFLTATPPVRLTNREAADLAERLKAKPEEPSMPVRAAYRFSLTFHRKLASGAEPDIGPLERVVHVVGPGSAPGKVLLKGTIAGKVTMAANQDLNYGSFSGSAGATKTVTLISQRQDLELETVPAEFSPQSLKVELGAAKVEGGQTRWSLTVAIPPNALLGTLDGSVILRIKGPHPQRVRIPIRGSARLDR